VVGHPTVTTTRPPRRARAKAPLSYHFLAAGHDQQLAVSVTGRLRKVTCWVPLEKAQSIRRVQGPLQRPLGLATVVLDVAGRDAGVYFKDRDAAETTALLDELAVLCREARRAAEVAGPLGSASEHAPAASPAPDAIPAGWYPDPSGRYRSRYWDGTAWTDHTA
jgi:putative membrane protein